MNSAMRCLAAGLACVLLAACGGRSTVVLVPDPDGHVGSAEVSTAGGKQVLAKSGDMTKVAGGDAPPSAVSTAGADYLARTFGEPLAIEPPPPEKFTLYFETGTTTLTAESARAVAAIVAASHKRRAIGIAVSGHTDTAGSIALNERLARERAEFVRQLLVGQGAEFRRMAVSSHGKGNPAVPTADGVAEPRNRRVEVILH